MARASYSPGDAGVAVLAQGKAVARGGAGVGSRRWHRSKASTAVRWLGSGLAMMVQVSDGLKP